MSAGSEPCGLHRNARFAVEYEFDGVTYKCDNPYTEWAEKEFPLLPGDELLIVRDDKEGGLVGKVFRHEDDDRLWVKWRDSYEQRVARDWFPDQVMRIIADSTPTFRTPTLWYPYQIPPPGHRIVNADWPNGTEPYLEKVD
jgi:hypothetical protein